MTAGTNPLVGLVGELEEDGLGRGAAKAAARAHGERGEVSIDELAELCALAREIAGGGEWRRALPIAEIAYDAAGGGHLGRPHDLEYVQAWGGTGADLIEVLHHGLIEHGDIRLYLRAKTIAGETIPALASLGLAPIQGLLGFRFGALLVDAYTSNRSPSAYQGQTDVWVARALQANDPELNWLVSGSDGSGDPKRLPATWPQPLEALAEAESHLREAEPLLPASLRGDVLKALVQALEWQRELGGEIDPDELRALATRALQELDPDDQHARLSLAGTLERIGAPSSGKELVRKLEDEWADYVAEVDPLTAWGAISQAASLLSADEPERALSLLDRQHGIEVGWASETLRTQHFELELRLFAGAYAPAIDEIAWDQFEAAMERAVELAAAASSPTAAREAAAALVAVMRASTGKDREGVALGLIDHLEGLDGSLWGERLEALRYLAAQLLRGEGINHMRAGEIDVAGRYYSRAATELAHVGMPATMVQTIEYLDDVVTGGGTELNEITAWLAAESLRLELAAPATAPVALQRIGSHVLTAQATGGGTSPEVLLLLLQVAKGRRFAAMLAEGTGGFALDERAIRLLAREAAAEAELPADSDLLRPVQFDPGSDENLIGDDELVSAWVNEYETGPSATPADRVANLQRQVERQLTASLLPRAEAPVAMPTAIRERLDRRTALLLLFEGTGPDGQLAGFQLLLTQDLEALAVGYDDEPLQIVQVTAGERSATMPQSGLYVGAIRRAVQSDPGPLDLDPAAGELLLDATPRYVKVVEDRRRELLEAGIERLVIAPHSSSHYLPIHLLGAAGGPLSNDFEVSYLTSLTQLTPLPAPSPRRQGVGVFGLSYADQPGLPPLEDSAGEVAAIAATCGTGAKLDGDATETAVRESLQSCRYVHIRAHGRLYVDAPSFHTVFLHPGDGEDGRLRAFELLPLDLRGLELVTLGACETALGRVDQCDNPRGLPAALLLAGAGAVAGTLWPVLAAASTRFFTNLYEALTGAADGDVAGSFAIAQRATRKLYPQHRDWGAFYLTGGHSGTGPA